MSELDPKEAPVGYRAELACLASSIRTCPACAFYGKPECRRIPCLSIQRKDGCMVVFKIRGEL